MKNIIRETDLDLIKVSVPCDVAGCLDHVHDGVLVGGGVGKLHGVTVGWWVWEKDNKYSVLAVIPTHSGAEYFVDDAAHVVEALKESFDALSAEFILPNGQSPPTGGKEA